MHMNFVLSSFKQMQLIYSQGKTDFCLKILSVYQIFWHGKQVRFVVGKSDCLFPNRPDWLELELYMCIPVILIQ